MGFFKSIGRKISRGTKSLGKKITGVTKQVGNKIQDVQKQVGGAISDVGKDATKVISKIDNGVNTAKKIVSTANDFGLGYVPFIGQASLAAENALGTASRVTGGAKDVAKGVTSAGNQIEKFNARKMLEDKAKEQLANAFV